MKNFFLTPVDGMLRLGISQKLARSYLASIGFINLCIGVGVILSSAWRWEFRAISGGLFSLSGLGCLGFSVRIRPGSLGALAMALAVGAYSSQVLLHMTVGFRRMDSHEASWGDWLSVWCWLLITVMYCFSVLHISRQLRGTTNDHGDGS